jgi:hypothetical protein
MLTAPSLRPVFTSTEAGRIKWQFLTWSCLNASTRSRLSASHCHAVPVGTRTTRIKPTCRVCVSRWPQMLKRLPLRLEVS